MISQKITLLFLILLCLFFEGKSQGRIKVNIPSPEEEAEYVWRTIADIDFFEKNNYQVSLPTGELIESLKYKAKNNSLSEKDYTKLKLFMQDSVYQNSDYYSGYESIENQLALINQMLGEIRELNLDWDFKEFATYQINLTLYGPGGSYNPEDGSVLIFTTPDGKFKTYSDPANTIIHEIIHIGIEESIIAKFKIPHSSKERIVDNFVTICFSRYLPDYKMQNMGDLRIDEFLQTKESIKELDKIVEMKLINADEVPY